MTLAVDTNVLLDVLLPSPRFLYTSLDCLLYHGAQSKLIISETVFAELSTQFPSLSDLRSFLEETGITIAPSSPQALFQAGNAWKAYRKRSSRTRVLCPECGKPRRVDCQFCGAPVSIRQHIVADFMIGAHALVVAKGLITRDRGFYRSYFQGLHLIIPGAEET